MAASRREAGYRGDGGLTLFAPDCERCKAEAVGYVTDDTAAAWLCRGDLKRFQVLSLSIGRTVGWFLAGEAA